MQSTDTHMIILGCKTYQVSSMSRSPEGREGYLGLARKGLKRGLRAIVVIGQVRRRAGGGWSEKV